MKWIFALSTNLQQMHPAYWIFLNHFGEKNTRVFYTIIHPLKITHYSKRRGTIFVWGIFYELKLFSSNFQQLITSSFIMIILLLSIMSFIDNRQYHLWKSFNVKTLLLLFLNTLCWKFYGGIYQKDWIHFVTKQHFMLLAHYRLLPCLHS